MKYKKYKRKDSHSFTLGIHPTFSLVQNKPDKVKEVILSSNAERSDKYTQLINLCQQNSISYRISDRQISILSKKQNCLAVGVFTKYQSSLNNEQNHIALVNPNSMANVGAIIRSMISFGFQDLALIKPHADILNPVTIRTSMGGVFHINFHVFNNFTDYQSTFTKHTIYPFMLEASNTLSQIQFKRPFTLVFGNEDQGLGPEFNQIGQSIRIEQTDQIDSLNLAISASLAMYITKS